MINNFKLTGENDKYYYFSFTLVTKNFWSVESSKEYSGFMEKKYGFIKDLSTGEYFDHNIREALKALIYKDKELL